MTNILYVLLYFVYAVAQAVLVVRRINQTEGEKLGTLWALFYIVIAPLVSVAVIAKTIDLIIDWLLNVGRKVNK